MLLPPSDTHFKPQDWIFYQLLQYTTAQDLCTNFRTAIDCGGHVGIMTHRMAMNFAEVHVYEPVHILLLKTNTVNYPNIVYHDNAVGDKECIVNMTLNLTNSGDNRVTDQGEITVLQKTIDSLNCTTVDFIKMDIQGNELSALQGAEQTIMQCRPVMMIEIENDDPNRQTIHNLLQGWGYKLHFKKNADHIFVDTRKNK